MHAKGASEAKMNLTTLTLISLLAGAATGLGDILAVLFKLGERNLTLGLGSGNIGGSDCPGGEICRGLL